MYERLEIKALIRKVANDDRFDRDEKILFYIDVFKRFRNNHELIKSYINEFAPDIWEEFNYENTIDNMTKIVKNVDKTSETSVSEIMKKLK